MASRILYSLTDGPCLTNTTGELSIPFSFAIHETNLVLVLLQRVRKYIRSSSIPFNATSGVWSLIRLVSGQETEGQIERELWIPRRSREGTGLNGLQIRLNLTRVRIGTIRIIWTRDGSPEAPILAAGV
jgi:hypothetical protein